MDSTNVATASGLAGGGPTAKTTGAIAREPAISIGALTALANAALVVVFAFVTDLTTDQRTAILAFAAVVVPLLGAIATRSKVSPVTRAGA